MHIAYASMTAAMLQLAGLYGFWMWRQHPKALLIPIAAAIALLLSALLLTRAHMHHPGRGFMTYIGFFAFLAILTLRLAENEDITRYDLVGFTMLIGGAALVSLGEYLPK